MTPMTQVDVRVLGPGLMRDSSHGHGVGGDWVERLSVSAAACLALVC